MEGVRNITFGKNFIFNNINSDYFNLILCSFDSSNTDESSTGLEFDIKGDFVNDKNNDYGIEHSGVIEFQTTIAHADGSYFTKTQMREIMRWLSTKENEWLTIYDDEYEEINYLGRFSKVTKKIVNGEWAGLILTFTSNSSYAYSDIKKVIINVSEENQQLHFYNDSDNFGFLYPNLKITVSSGTQNITIKNESNLDATISLSELTSDEIITIDNENQIIESSLNRIFGSNFNGVWLEIVQGDNDLILNGDCTIEMTYRFIREVGDF